MRVWAKLGMVVYFLTLSGPHRRPAPGEAGEAGMTLRALLVVAVLLAGPALSPIPAQAAIEDWPTYLHDAQLQSANQTDTIIGTGNSGQLVKKWSFVTGGPIAAGATVVGGVAYVGSWDGYEYALDAGTGALIWKTFLGITTGNPICSPPKAGVTSTATVQNGVVYLGGGDSNWYALDAATGAVLWTVPTGDNSATGGHYNWSSPLIYNGFAYIGIASMGDCPLVQGQLLQVNLSTHQVVNTFNVVPNGLVGGGIWTTPSIDPATNTIFVDTGTINDPSENLAQAVLALDSGTLTLKSSWQVPPVDTVLDSDWGTSPILFTDEKGNQLVSATNKNGYAYAFNRGNLAAGPVWRTWVAVGGQCPLCGDGSVASAAFAQGTLFVAGGNTTIGGAGYQGFVRALDPATGAVKWEHGTAGPVLPAVAWVNGLLVDGAGSTVEVLDASSGTRLYSYTTGAQLYGPPSVVNGTVYMGSTDGVLYAFDLGAATSPAPDPSCPSGWTCQDLGGPQPAGSETVGGGTWSLVAGGAGLGGAADQLRLASQALTGDAQVVARVTSLQSGGGTAQAGLMVRQSADPGSPDYAMVVEQNGNLVVAERSQFGGATATLAIRGAAGAPLYLEIQRRGDTFTAATSSDGTSFTLVPGATVALQLPSSVMAGMIASSGTNGSAGTAGFDTVSLGVPSNQPQQAPPANPCPSGWSCSDIGDPAVVGNQSLSSGTWTVQGAGGDIYEYTDQLHYVWQQLAGDGTVSARITSQANTSPYAKAGVMLRQSTDSGSPEYSALVTPSNGLLVQYRGSEGLRTTQVLSTPDPLPAYIEVARSQGFFSTYISADGITWTYLAGSSVQLSLSGGVLAGLAITSHNVTALGSATMDNVSVTTSAPPPPTACPSGWSCADVGNPTPAGAQSLSGSTWTIQGGGGDIWTTSDQFHYVWQSLAGDGTFSARVTSQTNTDPWAKAGVMLRQTTDPGSPAYAAFVTPGNGITVQYRTTQGGTTSQAAGMAGATPAYLEVARSQGTFTAYSSQDGVSWSPIPGSSVTMSWSGSALAGMAVTSHNVETASTVVFDGPQLSNTAPPPPTACPSGWSCGDMGGATPSGAQNLSGGTWTVQGGGGDIWGTSDQFHFVWQTLASDGTVSARVSSQSNTSAWAKAGVMLRQTTDPASPYYAAFVTPSNGVVVQYRAAQGGSAAQAVQVSGTTPAYLRAGRSGGTFAAYTSTDGSTWSIVPGSMVSLGITGAVLAGLAVTSHNVGALSTVAFDSVAISTAAPALPVCPSGWTCGDVGGATPAGDETLTGGSWTIDGGGGDIWGTSDQFHFDQQPLAGDGKVSAHLTSQANTSPWAKAGVMLRQTTSAGSPYYAVYVTPSNGVVVQYRSAQDANAVQVVQVTGAVPAYLRVARSGTTYTTSTSTDGSAWTPLAGSTVTIGISGGMLAGLAVTSHNTTAICTAVFDSVAVSA